MRYAIRYSEYGAAVVKDVEGPFETEERAFAFIRGTAPENLHTNLDARVWADAFMRCRATNPSIDTDRDIMVGWFANAMMAMHDHHQRLLATTPAQEKQMNEPIIVNALIDSVALRLENDCFLCTWVYLKYDKSTAQGFGGHVLGGLPDTKAGQHRSMPNFAAEAVVRILQVAGVSDWDKIAGKAVRVKRSEAGFGGTVLAIGHITEDIWYEPKACFDGWENARLS